MFHFLADTLCLKLSISYVEVRKWLREIVAGGPEGGDGARCPCCWVVKGASEVLLLDLKRFGSTRRDMA